MLINDGYQASINEKWDKKMEPQRNTLRSLKEYPFQDMTKIKIISAIGAHSFLRQGLLENPWEEAMEHELMLQGIE